MNFFIGKFLQVLYFPGITVVKKKILKVDLWEVSFLNWLFQPLGITTQFLFEPCVENMSPGVIFFGWNTVKIGIIRAKAQFSVWI